MNGQQAVGVLALLGDLVAQVEAQAARIRELEEGSEDQDGG